MNKLYFGDNLDILREHIAAESVDLIYLDPPFNSKRDYSVLFKTPKGHESDAQITAFEDSWHWGEQAEREFAQLEQSQHTDVAEMMIALRKFLGNNDMMAYLTMMANRLLELHRVLKPTGSLYLHCDPTASHYLKIVLDSVFGAKKFRNEIIWRRSPFVGSSKNRARFFPHNHDVILMFSKSDNYTFNQNLIPYTEEYKKRRFKNPDNDPRGPWQSVLLKTYSKETLERLKKEGALIEGGKALRYKFYLNEAPGGRAQDDNWYDNEVQQINPVAKERLPYPTQKPLALLERIIKASSNEGDVVLDPFCGCGTAVHAAQKLGRQWIGIDITHLAISLIEKRMKEAFPGIVFEVEGTPKDIGGARDLAERDKYQFQWWACSLVNAAPYQGKKKGSDGGIDGLIFFHDDKSGAKKIIVSVKGGGNVGVAMVKDLIATVEREKAAMGFFVTLTEPTRPMKEEAVSTGFYDQDKWGTEYPKLQILTIEGLMSQTERPRYPDLTLGRSTFKRAAVEDMGAEQGKLL